MFYNPMLSGSINFLPVSVPLNLAAGLPVTLAGFK
jgi:hypothetical protein